MRRLLSLMLPLLLVLTLSAEADASRSKSHNGREGHRVKVTSDCPAAEVQYGKCVPDQGDCGQGLRETKCRDHTNKIQCRIPCNWKKNIGDCKYRFEPWEPCDAATNTKSRSGTLKKALFNAKCQTTIKVAKPCPPKPKKV